MLRITVQIFIYIFLIATSFTAEIGHAQVKGKILLSVIDAGGNAGPYGIFYLNGPVNRTQIMACPRGSSGLYPTGITNCETTYGSSSSSEWQPGDILTARVNKLGSTGIPLDIPSNDGTCSWEFKGWSGACEGLGTKNPTTNEYECVITLPASGNVVLGAAFSGGAASGACPALTNPNPVTPIPTGTATPGGTDSEGDRLLSKLNEIADEMAENLKLKNFLKEIASKLIIPKNSEFKYDIKVTVTATGEGAASALPALRKNSNKPEKITPITGNPVIASGRGKFSTSKKTTIELLTSSKGMKIPKGRTSLEVLINVKALNKGEVVQSVSVTAIID